MKNFSQALLLLIGLSISISAFAQDYPYANPSGEDQPSELARLLKKIYAPIKFETTSRLDDLSSTLNLVVDAGALLTVGIGVPVAISKEAFYKVVSRQTLLEASNNPKILDASNINMILNQTPSEFGQRVYVVGLSHKTGQHYESSYIPPTYVQVGNSGVSMPIGGGTVTEKVEDHQLEVNPVTKNSYQDAIESAIENPHGRKVFRSKITVKNISKAELKEYLDVLAEKKITIENVTAAQFRVSGARVAIGAALVLYLVGDVVADVLNGLEYRSSDFIQ